MDEMFSTACRCGALYNLYMYDKCTQKIVYVDVIKRKYIINLDII